MINDTNTNTRVNMKIVNPLDNMDESKIEKLENTVNNFYSLANKSDISCLDRLSTFNDLDIEKELVDDNSTKELMTLLGINENELLENVDNELKETKKENTDTKDNIKEKNTSFTKENNEDIVHEQEKEQEKDEEEQEHEEEDEEI